jgi:hypothetical protein
MRQAYCHLLSSIEKKELDFIRGTPPGGKKNFGAVGTIIPIYSLDVTL